MTTVTPDPTASAGPKRNWIHADPKIHYLDPKIREVLEIYWSMRPMVMRHAKYLRLADRSLPYRRAFGRAQAGYCMTGHTELDTYDLMMDPSYRGTFLAYLAGLCEGALVQEGLSARRTRQLLAAVLFVSIPRTAREAREWAREGTLQEVRAITGQAWERGRQAVRYGVENWPSGDFDALIGTIAQSSEI